MGTPNQYMPNDKLSREGARPKDSICLDLYVPDGKGSRLSQMRPKCSGMLSHAGNLLFIIKLQISWKNMEPNFSEQTGLLLISIPWRLPPYH